MEDPDPMTVLGQRIRARRAQTGMSQADVAAHGDLGEATIRRIEKGELKALRSRTKTSLEHALDWRPGTVVAVLTGTADPDPEKWAETAAKHWGALGTAVRQRRTVLRLRQSDLESHGGPSGGTVKNIEQAARERYSPRTFAQLEQALDWKPGTVETILAGTADPDPEKWVRAGEEIGTPPGRIADEAAARREIQHHLCGLIARLADVDYGDEGRGVVRASVNLLHKMLEPG